MMFLRVMIVLSVLASVLVIGCAPQSAEHDASTSMAVPAPGAEGVEEMIVEPDPTTQLLIDTDTSVLPPDQGGPDPFGETPDDVVSESEIKVIEVEAKQWEFVPNIIEVNKGDHVKLVVTSTDVTHSLTLRDFGLDLLLSPGDTTEGEFIADKTGSFVFSCSVPCGRGHGGMKGTLVVS